MTAKKLFLFWMLLLCQIIFAQQDTIVNLKEVIISDTQLNNFSGTQSVLVLTDSVIKKNQPSLTTLLNYNSLIYFKENGLGMVSSPSFRGTTAQQTAVIWNGININSQLNGQTDFNTITTRDFDNITVRAGGGSSIYGSSALGGTVHLNSELQFVNRFQNELQLNYGSFETFGAHYKTMISNGIWSTQISVTHNSSKNDYNYLNTQKRNENGQFENTSLNASLGYRFSKNHYLKYYSQIFDSDRHFSGTLGAVSKSKYRDYNYRNLVEWDWLLGKITSKLKVAFLGEKYAYFENARTDNFETSKTETALAKQDLVYQITPSILINTILEYTQTKGIGSQIGTNTRQIGAATVLFKQEVFRSFSYEFSGRKEVTSSYDSPFLFSFGTKNQFGKQYTVVTNFSRNFRMPTFNDLYWDGLGNPNLKPESSYQGELGQHLKFKNSSISGTVYYQKIDDLIQWKPNASGNWSPSNIAKATSYGAEVVLNWNKKIRDHALDFNANYGYTVSKDALSDKQLVYVPLHKFNSSLAYTYQRITLNYQYLFTGFVFTSSDNSRVLEEYQVSNLGINYDFGNTTTYKLGFQVGNLWNKNYQTVSQRPMPGRNFNLYLIFNF